MFYRFPDAFFQLVREALSLVHVDADAFPQHEFHGGGMTEPHHDLDDEVNSLIVGRDAVEMHRVVYG